jgi:hypothetical protein
MLVLEHIVSPDPANCDGAGKSYARAYPFANAKRRRSRTPVPPVLSGRDQASPTPTMTIPHPLRVPMPV